MVDQIAGEARLLHHIFDQVGRVLPRDQCRHVVGDLLLKCILHFVVSLHWEKRGQHFDASLRTCHHIHMLDYLVDDVCDVWYLKSANEDLQDLFQDVILRKDSQIGPNLLYESARVFFCLRLGAVVTFGVEEVGQKEVLDAGDVLALHDAREVACMAQEGLSKGLANAEIRVWVEQVDEQHRTLLVEEERLPVCQNHLAQHVALLLAAMRQDLADQAESVILQSLFQEVLIKDTGELWVEAGGRSLLHEDADLLILLAWKGAFLQHSKDFALL